MVEWSAEVDVGPRAVGRAASCPSFAGRLRVLSDRHTLTSLTSADDSMRTQHHQSIPTQIYNMPRFVARGACAHRLDEELDGGVGRHDEHAQHRERADGAPQALERVTRGVVDMVDDAPDDPGAAERGGRAGELESDEEQAARAKDVACQPIGSGHRRVASEGWDSGPYLKTTKV